MKKTFDAVKFQRGAREEMSKRYISNREQFLRDLEKKYGHLSRHKVATPRTKG